MTLGEYGSTTVHRITSRTTVPQKYSTFSPVWSSATTIEYYNMRVINMAGYTNYGFNDTTSYFRYNNVGTYQGEVVDMKVMCLEGYGKHTVYIFHPLGTPKSSPIGLISYLINNGLKLQYLFYKHGTDEPIEVKGYTTVCDLDSDESVTFGDGFDDLYIKSDTLVSVNGTKLTGTVFNNYYSDTWLQWYNPSDDMQRYAVMATFSGDSFVLTYTSGDRWTALSLFPLVPFSTEAAGDIYDPYNAVNVGATKSSDGSYVPNADDVLFTTSEEEYGKEFVYSIFSSVPGELFANRYASWLLTDEFDQCLTLPDVSRIKIYSTDFSGSNTPSGEKYVDVTDKFSVSIDGNKLSVRAKDDVLDLVDGSFYGHTFEILVPVTCKEIDANCPNADEHTGGAITTITNMSNVFISRYINEVLQPETQRYSNTVRVTFAREQEAARKIAVPASGENISRSKTITYMLVYKNTTNAAQRVVFTDTVPKGTTYVTESANSDAKYDSGELTWTADIMPDTTKIVRFTVKVNSDAEGTIENTGNVVAYEYNSTGISDKVIYKGKTNTVSHEVNTTQIEEQENTKTAYPSSDVIGINGEITYTLKLKNTLDTEADLEFTDTVPENTVFVSASTSNVGKTTVFPKLDEGSEAGSKLEWKVTNVPAGKEVYVQFTVRADDTAADSEGNAKKISNTAHISAIESGTDNVVYDKDTNEVVYTIIEPEVNKSSDPPSNSTLLEKRGREVDYTLTYTNPFDEDIKVLFEDPLSEKVEFVSFGEVVGGTTIDKECEKQYQRQGKGGWLDWFNFHDWYDMKEQVNWTVECPAKSTVSVTFRVKIPAGIKSKDNVTITNKAAVTALSKQNDAVLSKQNTNETKYYITSIEGYTRKSDPRNGKPYYGRNLIFYATYENKTSQNKTVEFIETIPTSTSFVKATQETDGVVVTKPEGSYSAGDQLKWVIKDIPPGGKAEIQLVTLYNRPGSSFTNEYAFASYYNFAEYPFE